jgi:L-histidine N-alpha-methyltransferase
LAAAAAALAEEYPRLQIHGVVGDFQRQLDQLPAVGRRLVAFLGGTIGNLVPKERHRFLFDLDCTLASGDSLLLGADLVKDRDRLLAAYNDADGVTAEFNRNVLRVLNRELDAGFDPATFDHAAVWNEEEHWIEMRLRSRVDQTVPVRALGLEVSFRKGEDLLTEISAKFTREGVEAELWDAGFSVTRMWDEPGKEFLLTLATPYC